MAFSNGPNAVDARVGAQRPGLESQPDSEAELEKLESDLQEMAQKILEYRATLPDQLKVTLDSLISVHRPVLTGSELDSEVGPSEELNPDSTRVESITESSKADGEHKDSEKVIMLKEKLSANITATPLVLKRLKECITRIEKLDNCNGIIHPAFKKRKAS